MTRLVALGDIAEVNPGVLSELRSADPDTTVPFLPMAAVSEQGAPSYVEQRRLADVLKGFTCFAKGDVILAKITPCFENGKAAYLHDLPGDVGFGSTEFHVLRPGPEVDGSYLFHAIWNPEFRVRGQSNMTGTAGQKRVPPSYLRAVKIPLPPLAEQRRIAGVLDRVEGVRGKVSASAPQVEEYLKSVFLEQFGRPVDNPRGWLRVPLGETLSAIEAGWSANGEERVRRNDEYAVLKISAVTKGRFDPSQVKVVPRPPAQRSLVTVRRGDLLFSRANTRELVAATCLVESDQPFLFLPDKLWRLVPKAGLVTVEYLRYLLSNDHFRDHLRSRATGSSGSMLNVSQAKVMALTIPVPAIELQKQFATAVWGAYGLRNAYERRLTEVVLLAKQLAVAAFENSN